MSAARSQRFDCRRKVERPLVRLESSFGSRFRQIGAGTCTAAKTAERSSALFCSGKGGTGSLRYHSGLMFSHRGKDMDGKAIGLREIDGLEFDLGIHEVRNERNVPGQPFSKPPPPLPQGGIIGLFPEPGGPR